MLEKTLESPLNCKESQSVHPKGDQSWVFMQGLMLKLKLQSFGHLMRRAESVEKTLMLGKEEKVAIEDETDNIIDTMDMSLSKLWELMKDRVAWHATVQGVTKSWTRLTEQQTTLFQV